MALDTSRATCAGHQLSGGRSFRKQRTVNPLIVPARYSFLYASSTPACDGRPCADILAGRPTSGTLVSPGTPPFVQLLGGSDGRLLLVAVGVTCRVWSGGGHAYVALP
jgi:hypothetical protein